jgi:hypothetical protein
MPRKPQLLSEVDGPQFGEAVEVVFGEEQSAVG